LPNYFETFVSQSTERKFMYDRPETNLDSQRLSARNTLPVVRNILIVDLNNFARFPTLAIGMLVAALRARGHHVRVLCPLEHDVIAAERERQETLLDHLQRRVHLTDWPPFLGMRDALRRLQFHRRDAPNPVVLREIRKALENQPDLVLLSAYLQHFETVRAIGTMAEGRGTPILLGGPMFNIPDVATAWLALPGVSAVVGAEVDLSLPAMIETLCEGGDLGKFPGVSLPDGTHSTGAAPLRDLDSLPIPDFSDFPWHRYPNRIVPLMTGRGCQWNRCRFCSDVVSASGRSFRTRSLDHILWEMREQAARHDTRNFLFLDLKLNSVPDMLRGLAESIRRHVPGAEWIGTVHVDTRRDNGLSPGDLKAAVSGGMRRISFGLESGSQALLDLMRKGSSVERNSAFIRTAHEAGLSIRCTMFKGFPGETAEDMAATARFLEAHAPWLDRVRFNDFSLQHETPIYHEVMRATASSRTLVLRGIDARQARVHHRNPVGATRAYRRAKARALAAVHAINRRPLRNEARQFDGLM
jgi:anaerobic magnesium-protoporphyrin IX monomethyl ester cyclase